MTPIDMRQRAAGLEVEAQTLMNSIHAENRDLTEDEQAEVDRRLNEADSLTKRAAAAEAIAERLQNRNAPVSRPHGAIEPGVSEDDKILRSGTFRESGQMYTQIYLAGQSGSTPEQYRELAKFRQTVTRMAQSRSATGLNISVDPEGGDLIPLEYSTAVWNRMTQRNNVVESINWQTITGNQISLPVSGETSRANGSREGGIMHYYPGEAGQITASKPKPALIQLKLKKVGVLVYMTDEMFEDGGSIVGPWVDSKASDEIGVAIQNAIFTGPGGGRPLGLMNSPSLVTVAAESGQTGAVILAANCINMNARLLPECQAGAKWYTNVDCTPQLAQMYLGTGTYSGQLVWMPAGGITGEPNASILGKPVIQVEQAKTCGTTGDLILADLGKIVGIRKGTGIDKQVSMHLRFDYGEQAFRWTFRYDVVTEYPSAITPMNGSNTLSWAVAIATR